jgi:hypothetical protein
MLQGMEFYREATHGRVSFSGANIPSFEHLELPEINALFPILHQLFTFAHVKVNGSLPERVACLRLPFPLALTCVMILDAMRQNMTVRHPVKLKFDGGFLFGLADHINTLQGKAGISPRMLHILVNIQHIPSLIRAAKMGQEEALESALRIRPWEKNVGRFGLSSHVKTGLGRIETKRNDVADRVAFSVQNTTIPVSCTTLEKKRCQLEALHGKNWRIPRAPHHGSV